MENTTNMRYSALLRGINVGGKHKVAMADMRRGLEEIGLKDVKSLLNSGNAVFTAAEEAKESLEAKIEKKFREAFGFPIPVIIRDANDIGEMIAREPFKGIEVTPDIRLYVTFLKKAPDQSPELPWVSDDGSFRIIQVAGAAVYSVLDLSKGRTVEGMDALGKFFGNDMTTRNWNTVQKIANLLAN